MSRVAFISKEQTTTICLTVITKKASLVRVSKFISNIKKIIPFQGNETVSFWALIHGILTGMN